MRIRKRCVWHGHRWMSEAQWMSRVPQLPVEFCLRWRCEGSRVAPWVEEPLASLLRRSANRED
jgi:hypothetical protein